MSWYGNGLSPRVRGNPLQMRLMVHNRGSIPACAGEPKNTARFDGMMPVYPRVCGGTSLTICCTACTAGLSPRVRGNRHVVIDSCALPGSIPACAGEPSIWSAAIAASSVYPRVCGGTILPPNVEACNRGLSPRVRGNRSWRVMQPSYGRSIPACAGEPRQSVRSPRTTEVYPRVCGGTGLRFNLERTSRGLSPRVRGNPAGRTARRTPRRSIPACAGEPAGVDAR